MNINYKKLGITREEYLQELRDVKDLKPYILSLKEHDLNGLKCEICGKKGVPLKLYHKRYGKDVNYYDLILLCKKCSKECK